MEIGTLAHVLKNMSPIHKGRGPDPVGAFAPHLGQALSVAIHPCGHIVAANPGQGLATLWYFGGRAMRTTRTEIRPTSQAKTSQGLDHRFGLQLGQISQCLPSRLLQPLKQTALHNGGAELTRRGYKRRALQIGLASNRWPLCQTI